MENLLEMATKVGDGAEVFSIDEKENTVSFENAKLKDIASSIQSGMSLRIIRDGKVGFAYTRNLLDREGFLQDALDSLRGGAEAPEGFPRTKEVPSLDTYDPSIESVASEAIVEECERICDRLEGKTGGQLNLAAGLATKRIRLLNSQGTELTCSNSYYVFTPTLLYPGSYANIHRHFVWKSFKKVPEDILDHILSLFVVSEKEVKPRAGRMKVLFLPETLYVLIWRLQSATSGKMLYQKQSPLAGKIGEKIFHDKLTILDDPVNDELAGARSFDDEGIPCRSLPLVEKGVLKSYYYDLFYAKKLEAQPTGHGYKSAMWGVDTVSTKPTPSLQHLVIEPGDLAFAEVIRSMDRGVIVGEALGAHSGNIPNGDYSIGLSPGLYIEGGEIVGHVK
ncbi:MAG: TldD/PmbA family protein, partial [Candidatus Zixiibacteriota bacterium]